MKPLANLKTCSARMARGSLLLLAVLLAALSPAALRAVPLPYYAATVLPTPDGTPDTSLYVTAVNGNGDILLRAQPYTGDAYPLLYKDGQYITLPPPQGATKKQITGTSLSDRAADGTLYVCGQIASFPDPDAPVISQDGSYQTPANRGITWHVFANGGVTTQPLQNRILPPDSAFPNQEQNTGGPSGINSSGAAFGSTQSYLAGLLATWQLPGITCYADGSGGTAASYYGVDEAGNSFGNAASVGPFYKPAGSDRITLESVPYNSYGGYRMDVLRAGRLAGSHQQVHEDYKSYPSQPVIYDTATGAVTNLPGPTDSYQGVQFLNNSGDATGTGSYDISLWLRDPGTSAYTYYSFVNDILPTAPRGTGPQVAAQGGLYSKIEAILDDRSLVLDNVYAYTNYFNNAGAHAVVMIFKPGADPRPVITSATTINVSAYQPYSFQLTATNNPTQFVAGNLQTTYTGEYLVLPAGATLNPTTGVVSGIAPGPDTYQFDAAAGNGLGVGLLPTRIKVIATALAGVPEINNDYYNDPSGNLLESFSYQITATNGPTSFTATGLPPGLTINATTGVISGQPTTKGSYTVTVQAYNGVGRSAPRNFSINIFTGRITSSSTATATIGQAFSYQITAEGVPDNDPNSFFGGGYDAYGLPGGLTVDRNTGLISGTPADFYQPQVFKATVSKSNYATGDQAYATLVLTLKQADPTPPAGGNITSPLTANGTVGLPFSYQITADFTPTSYDASFLPDGLSVDQTTGIISGTPTQFGSGSYTATLYAYGSGGHYATLDVKFSIGISTANSGSITSPTTANAQVGKIFAYQVTADFTPTGYYAYDLPDGLSINADTGLISGQPGAGTAGVQTVYLYALDASGHQAYLTLNITVAAAATNAGTSDLTLTVVDTPDPVVVGGTLRYTFTLKNNGPDAATGVQGTFVKDSKMTFVSTGSTPGVLANGNVLTFPLPNLASGLSETYVLAFTASGAGVYTVAAGVLADQTDPHTADNSLLETTEAKAGSTAAHAPIITAAPGGQILQGDTFSYQITTDGSVTVDAYTVAGLPAGLSVDGSTGIISGTLGADAALGDFTVTLRAANGAGTSTATRTFTVVAPPDKKAADVTGSFGDLKFKAKTGKDKYKLSGSFTLQNVGAKALNPAKKPLAIGLYLSNSPTVSYPVPSDLASAGLLPLQVTADLNTLSVDVSLPKGTGTPAPLVLPVGLSKAGAAGDTLKLNDVSVTLKSSDLPAQVASGQYRYLVVVLDPANAQKEAHKSNNVISLDLRALFASAGL